MTEEVEHGMYPTVIQEVVEERQQGKIKKKDEMGTEEEGDGDRDTLLENQKEELPTF